MIEHLIYSSFKDNSNSIAVIYKGFEYTYEQFLSHIVYRVRELRNQISSRDSLLTIDSSDNFEHWISTIALMFLGLSTTTSKTNEGLPLELHQRKCIGVGDNFDIQVKSYQDMIVYGHDFQFDLKNISHDSRDWYRVFYSSGTTGTRKAIAVDSAMIKSRVDSSHYFFPNRKMCLSLMPPDSALGFHFHLGQWLKGGAVILDKDFFDIKNAISGKRINYLVSSPHQIISFIKDIESMPYKLNFSLDEIIISGAEITQSLKRKIANHFSSEITCLFGATETGHWSKNSISKGENLKNLGQLDKEVLTEVVDKDEYGRGNFRLKTRHMVSEYMDAQASNVFNDGWFYSGDIAIESTDGNIELVGRDDDVLNVAGLKVNLTEIDDFVSDQDGVIDAASFWIKDEFEYVELWMAVVLDANKELDSVFKLVSSKFGIHGGPKRVIPVQVIPRTYSGKPQRNLMSEKVTEQIKLLKSRKKLD